MRRARLAIAACVVALFAGIGPVLAVLPGEVLSDPALEARARALSAELRCMVCQNQSIDDSDAPLAGDLRVLLRERITAGDSDAAVLDFLVARYGEFILLKPRLHLQTALLWGTPFAILIIAGGVAAYGYRRRRMAAADDVAPLDIREQEALKRLVSGADQGPNIT